MMKQVHKSKKCQPTILTEDLTSEWLFGDLSEERNKEIGNFNYLLIKWKVILWQKSSGKLWFQRHHLYIQKLIF